MKFLNKLERRFGRFAIHHLTLYIIIVYILGYLLNRLSPSLINYMYLDPYLIIHQGQVWRIISWLLIPPSSLSIWTIIMLFFYYSIGTSLENVWGAFRYNLYIFFGILMTIVGAFLLYFITGGTPSLLIEPGATYSTYYICLSLFLGYALSFPDMQVMLYFFIPIKMKWMALVYAALTAIDFIKGGWVTRTSILFSLASVIIFFLMTRNYNRINPKEIKRKRDFQKAMSRGQAAHVTTHKCAICGRTEKDDPTLEFRFCSKCNGNYEYCQDHLFTHQHIR
ncbi:MAG: hypothetical protein PHG16_10280 [Lachnospiraceae bacterium]|nr:hypothetical protein [Lachnospiraceae bacterium]